MTDEQGTRHLAPSRVARAAVGLAALAVYLPSAALVLLALALSPPVPGSEIALLMAKAADAAVWIALGAWLLRDLLRLDLRAWLPSIFAWLWAWSLLRFIVNSGLFVWGY